MSLKPIIDQLRAMTTEELKAQVKKLEARNAKRIKDKRPPAMECDGYARLMLMHNALNERIWQAQHGKHGDISECSKSI